MASPQFEHLIQLVRSSDLAGLTAALQSDAQAVEARGPFGDTLLHYAAREGNEKMISLLVEHGADINARGENGRTPLLSAVIDNDRTKPVKALLDLGADPNIPEDSGKTPIYWAAAGSMPSMAKLLKKHGATVDIFTESFLGSPGKILKKLKAKPELLQQIPDLAEFAWTAIINKEDDVVHFLLAHGLDPNGRNQGLPLILWLMDNGLHADLLGNFLSRGADPNITYSADNPIGLTRMTKRDIDKIIATKEGVSRLAKLQEYYARLTAAGGDPEK